MTIEKMSYEEQQLVETNMNIVYWVIKDHIIVNEGISGLGYSDLFQEGCLALIKAARTHDAEKSLFQTYAKVVVKNRLIAHCKYVCNRTRRELLCSTWNGGAEKEEDDDSLSLLERQTDPADTALLVDGMRIIELLESFLPEYTGVAKKGIEAIILKMRGYNGADIADIYGVDQFNVGAWISRAKSKLLANERFVSLL